MVLIGNARARLTLRTPTSTQPASVHKQGLHAPVGSSGLNHPSSSEARVGIEAFQLSPARQGHQPLQCSRRCCWVARSRRSFGPSARSDLKLTVKPGIMSRRLFSLPSPSRPPQTVLTKLQKSASRHQTSPGLNAHKLTPVSQHCLQSKKRTPFTL